MFQPQITLYPNQDVIPILEDNENRNIKMGPSHPKQHILVINLHFYRTSHPGLGDFSHVRRYYGAQRARADSLQHPGDGQHPHGLGHHQHGPADEKEALKQHRAGPASQPAGNVTGREGAQRGADAEHRAEGLRVSAGHRKRQLVARLQHELCRRRPAEYRADRDRPQRRCNIEPYT